MSDLGHPKADGATATVIELTPDQREWVLVAIENELAQRGRMMASDPELNAIVIEHLTAVYRQLRDR